MGCMQSTHAKVHTGDENSGVEGHIKGDYVERHSEDRRNSLSQESDSLFVTPNSNSGVQVPSRNIDAKIEASPSEVLSSSISQISWSEIGAHENFTGDRIEVLKREAKAEFDITLCLVGVFDSLHIWYMTPTGGFTPSLAREGTFCEALFNKHPRDIFIVTDAAKDPRFSNHPSVLHRPYASFYAGYPLLSHGHCLGTFGLIDFQQAKTFSEEKHDKLKYYATCAVEELQKEMYDSLSKNFNVTKEQAMAMALPQLWVDVSDPKWPVIGSNIQWDKLSRVPPRRFNKAGGIWRLMGASDSAEYEYVQNVVKNKDRFLKSTSKEKKEEEDKKDEEDKKEVSSLGHDNNNDDDSNDNNDNNNNNNDNSNSEKTKVDTTAHGSVHDYSIDGYPLILCPLAIGNPRQYLFELRPADPDRLPPGIPEEIRNKETLWTLIVHARIIAETPYLSSAGRTSRGSVAAWSSSGSVRAHHQSQSPSLLASPNGSNVKKEGLDASAAAAHNSIPGNATTTTNTTNENIASALLHSDEIDDDDDYDDEEMKKNFPPVTPEHSYHNTPTEGSPRGDNSSNNNNNTNTLNKPKLIIPPRLCTLKVGPLIGHGSFGNVYSGFLLDEPVAIKVLEDIVNTENQDQRWDAQFEALLALDLRHPSVLSTLDFCIQDGTAESNTQVWIVQPLCQMGTLAGALRRGQLQENEDPDGPPNMSAVLATALEIAEGMQYLHARKILHGDLSSNNVLLADNDDSRGFCAVISDFGLSRMGAQKEITTKTVGTVSHMAPEILMEGVMSKAGDVYSFGVIVWELYCGQRAWHGSSMAQVIFAVTCRNERPVMPESAPASLRSLVDDCLKENKDERPVFEDIVIRLKRIITELGLQELLG